MKISILFILIFISTSLYCQQTIKDRIKEIRSGFKEINNSNDLTAEQFHTEMRTTEGAAILMYKDSKGSLRKIHATFYGEMGKLVEEFYVKDDKLFFAFIQDYDYNRPMYWDEMTAKENGDTEIFDIKKSEIKENRYYFDTGEKLIYSIDENKKTDFDAVMLKKKEDEAIKEFKFLRDTKFEK